MFETKLRRRGRGKPAAWGVIVCEAAKLRYDRRSLFYDRDGKPLHNYTTLAPEGKKLSPPPPPYRVERQPAAAPQFGTVVCDNPYKKEDSFEYSRKTNTALGAILRSRATRKTRHEPAFKGERGSCGKPSAFCAA